MPAHLNLLKAQLPLDQLQVLLQHIHLAERELQNQRLRADLPRLVLLEPDEGHAQLLNLLQVHLLSKGTVHQSFRYFLIGWEGACLAVKLRLQHPQALFFPARVVLVDIYKADAHLICL